MKTALVTGAASGIGAAIAERFLKDGYQVTLFDIDGQTAATTASRISPLGKVLVIEGDVSNEQHVKEAVTRTVTELGSLDVLINNAGIEINGTVVDLTGDQWEHQLSINLKGVFLFCKYAIPVMRGRSGSIINISSVHAYVSWPGCPAYDASKSALIGLTRAMALDHGKDGIRINTICPGYIETPLLERWFATGIVTRDEVLKFHPLGRIGTPNDVAEVALFLASEAASFISGTSITVDGGMTTAGH
jgi:NAD(P)-dependent dehydrogenase (short-subunit alcohol dehydrogenase family)